MPSSSDTYYNQVKQGRFGDRVIYLLNGLVMENFFIVLLVVLDTILLRSKILADKRTCLFYWLL